MLTCKVGNTIINCFDGKYDKHKLKEWSEKGKLVCPDCGKLYEYCHGEIKLPYFRHKEKNKDCTDVYYEPETYEHMTGKQILYKWLLHLECDGKIKNLRLEGYIPETKQRPDLYFEINDKRYVIEYQCTPIATEFIKRHELYELANIKDIWILGFENYKVTIEEGVFERTSDRYKEIENHTSYYLNVDTKELCLDASYIKQCLPYNKIGLDMYFKFSIEDFIINDKLNVIVPNDNILQPLFEQDIDLYNHLTILEQEKIEFESNVSDLIEKINLRYKHVNDDYYFTYEKSHSRKYYNWKIVFSSKYGDLYFFIKDEKVDCCTSYWTTRSYCFRGKRGGLGWHKYETTAYNKKDSLKYDTINIKIIENFITKNTSNYLRQMKYGGYYENKNV